MRRKTKGPLIIPNLAEHLYHADDRALSASGAKVLLGKRPPAEESEATAFGTLVHTAVLEPDLLDVRYTVLDPGAVGLNKDGTPSANPTATAAWKTAVAEVEKGGKLVVRPSVMSRALAMRDAVHSHPMAARILAMTTDTELSLYADHPSGARVRGRLDCAGGRVIADLKTARNADPAVFGKTVHDFGYHISCANYMDLARACGMDVGAFAFLNVETEPTLSGTYRVSVVDLKEDAIALGRALMHEGCERWLANGKTVDLPAYSDEFTTVDLPAYAYNNHRLEHTA